MKDWDRVLQQKQQVLLKESVPLRYGRKGKDQGEENLKKAVLNSHSDKKAFNLMGNSHVGQVTRQTCLEEGKGYKRKARP